MLAAEAADDQVGQAGGHQSATSLNRSSWPRAFFGYGPGRGVIVTVARSRRVAARRNAYRWLPGCRILRARAADRAPASQAAGSSPGRSGRAPRSTRRRSAYSWPRSPARIFCAARSEDAAVGQQRERAGGSPAGVDGDAGLVDDADVARHDHGAVRPAPLDRVGEHHQAAYPGGRGQAGALAQEPRLLAKHTNSSSLNRCPPAPTSVIVLVRLGGRQ
jgi:hypothetical protein